MRKLSVRTAWRYGSVVGVVDAMVISEATVNVDRTSLMARKCMTGFLRRSCTRPERLVAVVSEPASTMLEALAFISEGVMPRESGQTREPCRYRDGDQPFSAGCLRTWSKKSPLSLPSSIRRSIISEVYR